VPVARAAADLTWGQWKNTTLTPTHGVQLPPCQIRALIWPRSHMEARYSSLAGARALPPPQASRTKWICMIRRRTLGQHWRLCRHRVPVLSQATPVTWYMLSEEQVGARL